MNILSKHSALYLHLFSPFTVFIHHQTPQGLVVQSGFQVVS